MATTTLVPTGTLTGEWDFTEATHYESVDEGTATPDVNSYIETATAGDIDKFDMDTSPVDVDTVTQITFNVHGYIDDPSSTAQLQVNVTLSTDVDITGSPIYIDGSGLPGNFSSYNTTPETVSVTFASLSLSKADADGLRVSAKLLDS